MVNAGSLVAEVRVSWCACSVQKSLPACLDPALFACINAVHARFPANAQPGSFMLREALAAGEGSMSENQNAGASKEVWNVASVSEEGVGSKKIWLRRWPVLNGKAGSYWEVMYRNMVV
jgi:hypothetical protein